MKKECPLSNLKNRKSKTHKSDQQKKEKKEDIILLCRHYGILKKGAIQIVVLKNRILCSSIFFFPSPPAVPLSLGF